MRNFTTEMRNFTMSAEQCASVTELTELLDQVAVVFEPDPFVDVEHPAWYDEIDPDDASTWEDARRTLAYRDALRRVPEWSGPIPVDQIVWALAERGLHNVMIALKQLAAEGQEDVACVAVYHLGLSPDQERARVEEIRDRCRVEMRDNPDEDAPFAGRAARLREDLLAFDSTLAAIRALPTFRARSATGHRETSSRRSRASQSRAPDRPRLRLSAAGRAALESNELAAELLAALEDAAVVAHPLLHQSDAELWRFLLGFARNRLGLGSPAGDADLAPDDERPCPCGCSSFIPSRPNQLYANGASCRKRAQRQREKA